MSIKIINFNGEKIILNEIINHLHEHKPIIIATDTQWGICANCPEIINQIKQRHNKEIIQLIDNKFHNLIETNNENKLFNLQKKFINEFWPGQVTVVYKKKAYRRTDAKFLNQIVDSCKLPIYCSSANITNQNPINNINEALSLFDYNKFDIWLITTPNLPEIMNSPASTIIDINEFKIIREGVKIKEVNSFLHKHKISA